MYTIFSQRGHYNNEGFNFISVTILEHNVSKYDIYDNIQYEMFTFFQLLFILVESPKTI